MSHDLTTQLAQEWTDLEKKVVLGFSGHSEIAAFVRRWTLRAAATASEPQAVLLSLVNNATTSLTTQAQRTEALQQEGRRRAEQRTQQTAERQLQAQRIAQEQAAQREAERQRAREQLQRTQEETRQILRETAESMTEAADRRHQMFRVLTNPELFCPRCHQAYADTTRGCRNCTTYHYYP